MSGRISVIVPSLNEADNLGPLLAQLQYLREHGHELIVVDGGSDDNSMNIAATMADVCVESQRGRASQMNHGAWLARGDMLWFLHADSAVSQQTLQSLHEFSNNGYLPGDQVWGWFRVRLSGSHFLFRIIESMMNWRTRVTWVATGDMGLFVDRKLFEKLGGFDDIPLMEDIAISKKLKKAGAPVISDRVVVTSSRRWQRRGIISTILLMWWLRLAYFVGVSPSTLARWYRS